jgi:hypothetical protein
VLRYTVPITYSAGCVVSNDIGKAGIA